jgi:DNA-binding MarR family transcriptional regulator
VLVSLTPSGRVAVQAAHEQISAFRRRVYDSLEPEEREQAAALLLRLSQVLDEQTP